LCFLVEYLSPWIAMRRWDDTIQHGETLGYAIIDAEENDDDNKSLIYVNGHEKCQWPNGILDSDNLTIETHDAEDIDSSRNLNITNTMRCGNHVKNCALQNILKIYNG